MWQTKIISSIKICNVNQFCNAAGTPEGIQLSYLAVKTRVFSTAETDLLSLVEACLTHSFRAE